MTDQWSDRWLVRYEPSQCSATTMEGSPCGQTIGLRGRGPVDLCGLHYRSLLDYIRDDMEYDQIRSHVASLSSQVHLLEQRLADIRFQHERSVGSSLRSAVFERDGLTCTYCSRVGEDRRVGPDRRPWHMDHRHPWSLGGETTLENLTLACASCNLSKGNKTEEEFRMTFVMAS